METKLATTHTSGSDPVQRLRELVSRFEGLDKRLTQRLKDKQHGALQETLQAKIEVKNFLAALPYVKYDPRLNSKLKKIRDDQGYNIDKVLGVLARVTGDKISQALDEHLDWREALYTEGTADYVDEDYFRRKNEIGTLIVGQSLPPTFSNNLRRVKECYALGLFDATIIFCRAAIEASLFEALKRRGVINARSRVSDIDKYSLQYLLREGRRFIERNHAERVHMVTKAANNLLHSKRKRIVPVEKDALLAVQTTFTLMEQLFS